MLFSSTVFLFFFLPVTVGIYYVLDRKFKNYWLLITSLLFYSWGEPKFIFVMLGSIFMNYLFALLVDKFRENKKAARFILTLTCIWNIGIFFVYKYLNFTIDNINHLFGQNIPLTNIVLPIGISFFTFQAMSYVIDVYRKNGKVQKNPFNVALYITFFPQLIAGPIVRYETVADEINFRKETLDDFYSGIKRFVVGLCKKLIISNSVAVIADFVFDTEDLTQISVLAAWAGAVCYTLQIYFDFSGYSDMAIGLGKMFGFHFNENFDYPYASASVSEFWRRWHISLGTWFRDYVYFPLGGSRVKSKARLVFNLFVVWMLTGIWHGASWNFVLWGLFYFVLLTFEKLTGIPKKLKSKPVIVIYRIFTILCIILGWVLFRSNGLTRTLTYLGSMAGLYSNPLSDPNICYMLSGYIPIIAAAILFSLPVTRILQSKTAAIAAKHKYFAGSCEAAMILIMAAISFSYAVCVSYNPFIYFNF